MTQHAQMFTARKFLNAEVTITATAQSLSTLIATAMATAKLVEPDVLQCIIMAKTAAGVDRDAILVGHVAGTMKMYYGAGVDCDPPVRDLSWVVKRAGGSDVTATVLILLA